MLPKKEVIITEEGPGKHMIYFTGCKRECKFLVLDDKEMVALFRSLKAKYEPEKVDTRGYSFGFINDMMD